MDILASNTIGKGPYAIEDDQNKPVMLIAGGQKYGESERNWMKIKHIRDTHFKRVLGRLNDGIEKLTNHIDPIGFGKIFDKLIHLCGL